MRTYGVGIVGFGTVGVGVAQLLLDRREWFRERAQVDLFLKRVCDVDLVSKRDLELPAGMLTDQLDEVIGDPEISAVVELIGGTQTARDVILAALEAKKDVVTANKALLATHGTELFERAAKQGVSLAFEASVCGGVPLIRALTSGLRANRIESVSGIVNGTCNYILTQMTSEQTSYPSALREAQVRGYAERNPSLDVDGTDSAHKLVILGALSFGTALQMDDIHVEGISQVDLADIQFASELGYTTKLLAIGKRGEDGIELRVHPTLLPHEHPLASVGDVFNAVCVRGDAVGKTMYYGRGAGRMPTASAAVADLLDLAMGVGPEASAASALSHPPEAPVKLKPMAEIESSYYFRFSVLDQPGVLGKIARVLGNQKISIASVYQRESAREQASVSVVMLTYQAREAHVQKALKQINHLRIVQAPTKVLRIERD